jgi:protoheme IX farnesyltransferase
MSYLTLFRPPIALMTAVSALAGYALYPAPTDAAVAGYLLAGVGLLAAGGSALNQVQERDVDARMRRTCRRPVASGRLSACSGLLLALLLVASGLLLLASVDGSTAGLGAFALLWYNGVYTPLKRITAFAALPGTLCGALPPLIGWAAAGGTPGDYRIVLLAGLLCLWQIPHFWFFALKHRQDFLQAGLPTIFDRFTADQVQRLALVWVCSLAGATLLLPAFGLVQSPVARFLCGLVAAGLAAPAGLRLLQKQPATAPGGYFARLNLALLVVLSSLLVEGFA